MANIDPLIIFAFVGLIISLVAMVYVAHSLGLF
jgi:hypothetical protein